jgi:hypothetical protein
MVPNLLETQRAGPVFGSFDDSGTRECEFLALVGSRPVPSIFYSSMIPHEISLTGYQGFVSLPV